HSYQITLVTGQCLQAVVEQRGIDIKAVLPGPDNKPFYEFHSEFKGQGQEKISVAHCQNSLAILNTAKTEYTQPESRVQLAILIYEKPMGQNSIDLSRTLLNLGALYRHKSEYAKSETVFLRALNIQENKLGPGHINLALFLNNFVNLYVDKGEYQKGEM